MGLVSVDSLRPCCFDVVFVLGLLPLHTAARVARSHESGETLRAACPTWLQRAFNMNVQLCLGQPSNELQQPLIYVQLLVLLKKARRQQWQAQTGSDGGGDGGYALHLARGQRPHLWHAPASWMPDMSVDGPQWAA